MSLEREVLQNPFPGKLSTRELSVLISGRNISGGKRKKQPLLASLPAGVVVFVMKRSIAAEFNRYGSVGRDNHRRGCY